MPEFTTNKNYLNCILFSIIILSRMKSIYECLLLEFCGRKLIYQNQTTSAFKLKRNNSKRKSHVYRYLS